MTVDNKEVKSYISFLILYRRDLGSMIFLQYTFRAFCWCDFIEKKVLSIKKYIHIYIEEITRTKATRCEALRTFITDGSKNTHFDILPQCIIDCWWKRSILIYHELYRIWSSEMSSRNGSLEPKMNPFDFFISKPFYWYFIMSSRFW